MADAQFKELLATAKTLKDNKQDAEAIHALEKLIATGNYYNIILTTQQLILMVLLPIYFRWTIKRNY